MNVPGIFVCRSFLIRVCMIIVSKALLISSATVLCFVPVLRGFVMFAVM